MPSLSINPGWRHTILMTEYRKLNGYYLHFFRPVLPCPQHCCTILVSIPRAVRPSNTIAWSQVGDLNMSARCLTGHSKWFFQNVFGADSSVSWFKQTKIWETDCFSMLRVLIYFNNHPNHTRTLMMKRDSVSEQRFNLTIWHSCQPRRICWAHLSWKFQDKLCIILRK